MYPPSRIRRILKWTGAVVCISILITSLLSVYANLRYCSSRESFTESVEYFRYSVAEVSGACLCSASYLAPDFGRFYPDGLSFERRGPTTPLIEAWLPLRRSGHFGPVFVLPLWIPLFVAFFATAWLWHRDRRRIRPGCCLRCGYDLTGNTSGVCSECGEKATATPDNAGQ